MKIGIAKGSFGHHKIGGRSSLMCICIQSKNQQLEIDSCM